MNLQSIINTLNRYKKEFGCDFTESVYIEPKRITFRASGKQDELVVAITNGYTSYIKIGNKFVGLLFNAKGSRKGFLQAFVNAYKIPSLQFDSSRNKYVYQNDQDGWSIEFDVSKAVEVTSIFISKKVVRKNCCERKS